MTTLRARCHPTDALDRVALPHYRHLAHQWLSSYSTTALVGRRLPLKRVFRTSDASNMGRVALFNDPDYRDGKRCARKGRIRLEVAHRESLEANPRLRPAQVAFGSRLLLHASALYAAGF